MATKKPNYFHCDSCEKICLMKNRVIISVRYNEWKKGVLGRERDLITYNDFKAQVCIKCKQKIDSEFEGSMK